MNPQDAWITNPAFGVDPAVVNTCSASGASDNTPPAEPSGSDSDSYKRGYQDGLKGQDANPGPLTADLLTDYQEGYAKGKREFGETPAGKARQRAADLDRNFKGWLAERNWPNAAEALNGFNRDEIEKRLAQLSIDKIQSIHQGALDNPRVGPKSQVAQMTGSDDGSTGRDGETWETVKELAKSKGLVIAGEQIGKKVGKKVFGGLIGWVVDTATSPGGDTSLAHLRYQAVVMVEGMPVPCQDASLYPGGIAGWHRKRENAEKDAKAYTAKYGEEATVDEHASKDPDDPE
jgi:hypothetical protein